MNNRFNHQFLYGLDLLLIDFNYLVLMLPFRYAYFFYGTKLTACLLCFIFPECKTIETIRIKMYVIIMTEFTSFRAFYFELAVVAWFHSFQSLVRVLSHISFFSVCFKCVSIWITRYWWIQVKYLVWYFRLLPSLKFRSFRLVYTLPLRMNIRRSKLFFVFGNIFCCFYWMFCR